MTSKELRRRSLWAHESATRAIVMAVEHGNVAFVTEEGRFLTCTRSHVCARINAGQKINVLVDYEKE